MKTEYSGLTMVKDYFSENRQFIMKTLEELALIPAPSFNEAKRAGYCIGWLRDAGIDTAFTDECGNVILSFANEESSNNRIFMAHLDTVFPEETELEIKRDGNIWSCPGIGDDTANAVCLLMLVKYLWENAPKMLENCIFVWDVCEEGLGNLSGSRAVTERYGKCTDCLVSYDLYSRNVYNSSIGSIRYEVKVTTEGGHSYHDFGKENAIAAASRIISRLYGYVPSARTTYNVGVISGGTSVNSIAGECSFLWEFRSDDRTELEKSDKFFREIIAESGAEYRVIGERPCMGNPDRKKMDILCRICADSIRDVTGKTPAMQAASTDCNIPLSMDIPAVCTGLICGGNAHRTDEWVDVGSMTDGCMIAYKILEKMKNGYSVQRQCDR